MLVDLGGKVFDQLLLSRHSLNQPLKLGGRNGGLGRSRDNGSGGNRSRSGSDGNIDRGAERQSRLAEGRRQADASHMSFAAAMITFDLGMPVLTVGMRDKATTAAPFVHNLSPFVLFLFLHGERGKNLVEPVSINVYGIRITERER